MTKVGGGKGGGKGFPKKKFAHLVTSFDISDRSLTFQVPLGLRKRMFHSAVETGNIFGITYSFLSNHYHKSVVNCNCVQFCFNLFVLVWTCSLMFVLMVFFIPLKSGNSLLRLLNPLYPEGLLTLTQPSKMSFSLTKILNFWLETLKISCSDLLH